MTQPIPLALMLGWTLALTGSAPAQNDAAPAGGAAACPMHAKHMADAHHDGVDARGDREMGFGHDVTTHHFRLTNDGGAIEVSANDAADTASREAIRSHLRAIARKFAEGDFEIPAAVHDRVPPGVETMERRKSAIDYTYEETDLGARVRIATSDAEALRAVHAFLRFQIEDHRTEDPVEVR
jgi:hypothetical protein